MSNYENEGFIIRIVACGVAGLQKLSAVEHWKKLGQAFLMRKHDAPSDEALRKNANLWIDWFILLKWALVFGLIWRMENGWLAGTVVSYLLFFNLFSYFYYHGWGSDYDPPRLDRAKAMRRDRRRLVSFLLAFLFSIFGFAYLYATQIACHLEWPSNPNRLDALYLSISNSFTLTYEGFQPKDQLARGVLLLQLINVFLFLTVLIGNAIPTVGRSEPH